MNQNNQIVIIWNSFITIHIFTVNILQEKPGDLPKNLMLKSPSKGPCPERALFCLTQGVGYIAVVEFDHTGSITIEDPERENMVHQFSDQNQAADWLNR